ncbi:alanine or glycine:cation symporter, AGCS family [Peptoclostridium litorale DSM 5388]|uniref:Sodium/glycine symporter GlyP n=1 Tax=Peptoclostridium litorale DSM 5388 TaxID=1121324 RepID=A0A069RL62_PEPLI|nr:sodium:alanine symporter family protein [Peptoclostridium litorale]KDR94952.1 sodium/glycine symporter GlyP [Peptoclostridium litorale DSM 5388]SIO33880.1 alanine or glycine:cation symporter, AGCS family [Peptoclostridium litorale DSM 5388]
MEKINQIAQAINSFLWGPPLLILLVGTGIYLSFRLGFLQVFKLPLALKYLFSDDPEAKDMAAEGDVSAFAAVCTALSATIGTGNIVGVATAIRMGGPGALFWMWMAAFFGMATKYAEALLAVKYRVVDENGQMSGGPMYYIERGLKNKFLAKCFAIFGIGVAFFGIGTFAQVNSITSAVKIAFNVPIIITGVILTISVAMVTLGGIKSIAKVSELVVPFMAGAYILGTIIILIMNASAVPGAFAFIVKSAFTPTAAAGGFMGSTVALALKSGVSRGVFSNESGLGSAPIAAAAARTKSCVRQGLVQMTGTFFDTIIVCTMTGITLVLTGMWNNPNVEGAGATTAAFRAGLPAMPIVGELIVTIGLIFFAFTTILGWNYYGERCTEYLFGVKGIKTYKYIFIALIAIGPFLKLQLIWTVADIVNGLMAIPNLIAIIGLSGVIASETKQYFEELKEKQDKQIA